MQQVTEFSDRTVLCASATAECIFSSEVKAIHTDAMHSMQHAACTVPLLCIVSILQAVSQ
jgi:hypothetical protein